MREALHNATKRPASLRRVREAILLPTKIARLEAMVDEVIERLERPPRPNRRGNERHEHLLDRRYRGLRNQ